MEGENEVIKRHNLVVRQKKFALGIYLLLFFVLIFNYHFFYIIPYPNFLDTIINGNRYFVVFGIIGVLSAYYCFQCYPKMFAGRCKTLFFLITIYIIAWLFEASYSWLVYNQDISSVIGAGGRLLLVTYSIPFLVLFERDGGPEHFWGVLNNFAFIWAVAIIIQSVVYQYNGSVIFDLGTYFQNNTGVEIKLLNGTVRLTLFSFGNIMIIYNFYRLYSGKLRGKTKLITLIYLLTGIFAAIFVQQTRMYTIIISICFISIIIMKKSNWKMQLFKSAFIISLVAFLLYSPVINNLLESFSVTGSNRWSTQARLYAIQYYWGCIQRKPFFGNGFLSDDFTTILHGATGQAHYSDVGLLGLVAETGFFSIVFFIVPLIMMVRGIIRLKKANQLNSLDIALIIYVLTTSFTLILTVGKYCYALAFILAYYEYRVYHQNEKR